MSITISFAEGTIFLKSKRFFTKIQPKEFTDWGILGAIVGNISGSYWEVPIIEGVETIPSSDEMKHLGAAMASYGSTPLFHIDKITPEAINIKS